VLGIDESQLHLTLLVVLNVPLSTETSIPLNTPCSSLPTPSSHKADLTEAQVRAAGYEKDIMRMGKVMMRLMMSLRVRAVDQMG